MEGGRGTFYHSFDNQSPSIPELADLDFGQGVFRGHFWDWLVRLHRILAFSAIFGSVGGMRMAMTYLAPER